MELTRREVDITIRCTRKQVCPRMGKLAKLGFQRRQSNKLVQGFDDQGPFFRTKVEFTDDNKGSKLAGLKSIPWVLPQQVLS